MPITDPDVKSGCSAALAVLTDMVIDVPSGLTHPTWLDVAVVQEIVPDALLIVLASVWRIPFAPEVPVGTLIVPLDTLIVVPSGLTAPSWDEVAVATV